MTSVLVLLVAALVVGAALWQSARLASLARAQEELPELVRRMLAEADPASSSDVHTGFVQQTDRTRDALQTLGDRVREALATETERAGRVAGEERDRQDRAMGRLGDSLAERFDALREAVARELAEGRELLQRSLRETSEQLATEVQAIAKTTDGRLEQISGKVEERLDEGFKKTNETFVSVMAGLARIDEAQKKIDGLASNVIGLQEILGDKRSRGAFGEVQLEGLVRNALPEASFSMQHTFSTGVRADCAIFLPEPTGTVAVDSKFPLESYRKMTDPNAQPGERKIAERQFAVDVKRHVEDIANKYLIPGETSDGAVMFVPAESVFAEIHDKHPELVNHAHARRVWIVSPTTMWATLNTARAVLKDVETRKQVHVIQSNLTRLGKEFERFDVRMKKLADHIRLAQQDAEDVQTTSKKISDKFKQIEGVELDEAPALPEATRGAEEPQRQLGA